MILNFRNFIPIFFIFSSLWSQHDYEYMGVIQLSEADLISYKIMFSEDNGAISGYSITDLGGPHETKSFLSGYFSDEKNALEFYESGILYTKSPITQNDFCYVHFNGTLKKLNERQQIEGSFKGMYDNGDECIHGDIKLANFGKVLKKAKKLDKKIDRNVFVSKEKKDKINISKSLDTLSMNIIAKGQVLSVFTKDSMVKLRIYDGGKEDGDKINLWVDGRKILENYSVTKKVRIVEVPVTSKETKIVVEALNVGTSAPNTVRIEISDRKNFVQTRTNLNATEKAGVTLIKQ